VAELIGVLDCAVSQLTGFSFFEMLQALKAGDKLGLSWYNDRISSLHRSPLFPKLARASGDYANTSTILMCSTARASSGSGRTSLRQRQNVGELCGSLNLHSYGCTK